MAWRTINHSVIYCDSILAVMSRNIYYLLNIISMNVPQINGKIYENGIETPGVTECTDTNSINREGLGE